jgi:hypothetical protein
MQTLESPIPHLFMCTTTAMDLSSKFVSCTNFGLKFWFCLSRWKGDTWWSCSSPKGLMFWFLREIWVQSEEGGYVMATKEKRHRNRTTCCNRWHRYPISSFAVVENFEFCCQCLGIKSVFMCGFFLVSSQICVFKVFMFEFTKSLNKILSSCGN